MTNLKENSIWHGLSLNTIYNMDCIEGMKLIPDNSIDCIITDPPYEIWFMGKWWDDTGIANNVDMWKECLRVLKPWWHLLSFAATRTYHRMACAIDDAGFEVRDMVEWVYGSGFPKSLNIGKAVDKLQGNEREVLGEKPTLHYGSDENVQKYGFATQGNIEITKGNSEWEGWGTALKPAHEPICMARKPLAEKTVALNVLKYGTGGINIDESRVETEDKMSYSSSEKQGVTKFGTGTTEQSPLGRFPANLIHDNSEEVRECFPETKSGAVKNTTNNFNGSNNVNIGGGMLSPENSYGDSGNASRFFKSIIYQAKASKSERNKGCEGLETSEKFTAGNYSQSPTCKDCEKTLNGTNDHSKCSGEVYYKEMESKNTKNNHPTVKPIALMEYLIKMVTKEWWTVLDPFVWSWTTLVAAKKNWYNYIWFELDEWYRNIANKRIQDKLSEK